MTRSFAAPCALAAALLLAACGSTPTAALRGVRVIAGTDINQGSAAALDIVFVYDAAALPMLPRSGPAWFENRQALRDGLANGIDVVSLEMVQATQVDVTLPPRARKAIGVYAFANYVSAAGQPMANLTPYKNVTIRLTPTTVVYSGS